MPASPRGAGLRLERVFKQFARDGQSAVAAVRDVSLAGAPGELVTLLGPTGCGKTTTLRIVAGVEHPDAGRVWGGDDDVTALPVYRRSIGFVFQNYALFPHLTVFENAAYGLRVKRLDEAEVRRRVDRVLGLVGLPAYGPRFPHPLSGGEQQRVAVARAVVVEPQLLLFDEPLSNLDAKLRVEMRGELSRLQRQLAITTIYVTHDQEEAMAISDRVAVMRGGRIAQVGTAHDLYTAPASLFVAQFIGRANIVASRVARVSGGAADVELWGREVRVSANAACEAGRPILLALRPESVRLLGVGVPAGDGEVVIPGTIRARTFLGEKVEYVVDAGGASLEVVAWDPLHHGLLDVGAAVRIACDPRALRPLAPDDDSGLSD